MNQDAGIQLKTIRLASGETYVYRERGSGSQVLLLIHGNLSSSILWDLLMEALPEAEYRVLAPDLRGFGDSTYQQPVRGMQDFSQDLLAFADALSLDRFAVMGWSMGGLIALLLAADHPERVSHLVLLGASAYAIPTPKRDAQGEVIAGSFWSSEEDILEKYAGIRHVLSQRDEEGLRQGLDSFVYRINQPPPARYAAYVQEIFKQRNKHDTDMATLYFNISHQHNGICQGSGKIDRILCPVLVFQGDQDLVVPPRYGQELADWIGDNAQLQMLENTSHSPLVDSLEQVVAGLRDFVPGKPSSKHRLN